MNERERRLLAAFIEQHERDEETPLLRNLSNEAAAGKLPPFVGRFSETTRLLETVNRRSKASALLVGPAVVKRQSSKTWPASSIERVASCPSAMQKRACSPRVFSI